MVDVRRLFEVFGDRFVAQTVETVEDDAAGGLTDAVMASFAFWADVFGRKTDVGATRDKTETMTLVTSPLYGEINEETRIVDASGDRWEIAGIEDFGDELELRCRRVD